MKTSSILTILIVSFIFISCGPSKEEIELQRKRTQDSIDRVIESAKQSAVEEAQRKAEEERQLAEKAEFEKQNKKYSIDDIIGIWDIRMTCTSSTCDNTSKGDIKMESWNISYQNKQLIVRVSISNNTNTHYTGTFNGKNLILKENVIKNGLFKDKVLSVVEVNLHVDSQNEMNGTREVVNDGPCKIEYIIRATK